MCTNTDYLVLGDFVLGKTIDNTIYCCQNSKVLGVTALSKIIF